MRVAGIELIDHPTLGSISIDFRDKSKNAPSMLILAGENGCGKTVILECIFTALAERVERKAPSLAEFRYQIFVEVDDWVKHAIEVKQTHRPSDTFGSEWDDFDGIAIRMFYSDADISGNISRRYLIQPSTKRVEHSLGLISDLIGNGNLCFLSEASTFLEVPDINNATGKVNSKNSDYSLEWNRGNDKLVQEISQLIVDLRIADNNDLGEWLRRNESGRPPNDLINKRMDPFNRAFARLFTTKRFIGIDNSQDLFEPMFEQFGKRMSLAALSTGEKQIIFRGAFLLNNAQHLPQSVVLLDEPELSLHPAWQSKICSYYESIVQNGPENHNQIIITTHSPFVVHGSLGAKHVILRRDEINGSIYVDPTPTFPGISLEEIAVAAFELPDLSGRRPNSNVLIVTEGPSDVAILKRAWSVLNDGTPAKFEAFAAGAASTIRGLLGHEKNVPAPLAETLSPIGIDRFIGLFDFDVKGYGQWNGTAKSEVSDDISLDISECSRRRRTGCLVWSALLPVPTFRHDYASHDYGDRSCLSIEHLFPNEYVGPYLTEVASPGGGKILRASRSQKAQIAEACMSWPAEAFNAFQPIFRLVDHVIDFHSP